jgi:chloramphenicol 3-O phosphotransferase
MKNMKVVLIAPVVIAVVILYSFYFKPITQPGVVIILNGPSASGKSSIQKEFQSVMMPNLWIKLGIDNLFDKPMPDITLENMAYWQEPNLIRWVTMSKDKDENPVMALLVGEQGDKVAYGMNSAIAAYAENGCNIIVDYIAYKKEWIDDLQAKLKKLQTYWVKVEIPLSVLEDREVARATSPKGHARSHYETVYWNVAYDLTVNSDKDSAKIIAQQIKDFLKI